MPDSLIRADVVRGRHGHAVPGNTSPTYRSWAEMRKRCLNPNCKAWKDYGGRGIKVCERWNSFENFLADMGLRPGGMTLERRDSNSNYEPNNCRWATRLEQNRNSRACKLTADDVREIRRLLVVKTQGDIATQFKVSKQLISAIATRQNWKDV